MDRKKTFYIYNHQGKGDYFVNALVDAGYKQLGITEICEAGIVLTDVDIAGRVVKIEKQIEQEKTKLFCYPHAARPFIGWDGLFQPTKHTSASFVFADGHKEVIRAYGYKKPLHTVGWAYSEIKPFKPAEKPQKILFAPIHPNANGWLSKMDQEINGKTFRILLDVVRDHGAELTVRHIKPIESNGLWKDSRVNFVRGDAKINQRNEMEWADVVVSHQTFAWISVALGKPTVMIAEYEAPRNGRSESDFKKVSSWGKYKHLLMYPLDILDTQDPYGLLCRACETDKDIVDWKWRMIGDQVFDGCKFIRIMESYL